MSNRVTFMKNGRSCTITIANESPDQFCTTDYTIRVYDKDDERWEHHARTSIRVAPNTVHTQGYHKWSATDWQHTVLGNYCQRKEDKAIELNTIDTPKGKAIIDFFDNEEINEESLTNVRCSGSACSKIQTRFKNYQNRLNWEFEVTNTSDKQVDVKIVWVDFLGGTGQSRNITLNPFESQTHKPTQPNRHIISVMRIEANY
ncbi:hypothetical protein H3Z83_07475 [Tenacibaculum sp. S7007]|uniref:Uncharacterized protein n=1 Tax=Tenacibaculum pelagium TaxID=2759527 RepID=A0A839ARS8_9FLAO|nr:hypothetical protein [Tenacibaculum pelagium]MBA6156351.1 hypothetical protein [Tenacibaculum pelagium]